MPITVPTRAEILEQIKADILLELGTSPLRRSVEYALARALTGQSKGEYGFLTWIFRQCFPDTADEDAFWRWARIFGIDQTAATPWQGTVRFTGTDTTTIPAGTQIVRSDGETYATDADQDVGESVSGYVDVACTAVADSYGADANNEDGQPLTLVSPISGVNNACTAQDTTHTGADIEDAEDGLVRLLVRLRTPPSGGGPGDYVAWALEVDGVTRAWEFANLDGPNSVSVAFVRDDDGSGSAILPDSTERDAVQTHLEDSAPITVGIDVIELTALTVDITITDLVPDTSAVKAAIEASLQDFFTREAEPGATIELSRIDAAISEADGETSHTLTVPAAAVTAATNEIPILGTITYA